MAPARLGCRCTVQAASSAAEVGMAVAGDLKAIEARFAAQEAKVGGASGGRSCWGYCCQCCTIWEAKNALSACTACGPPPGLQIAALQQGGGSLKAADGGAAAIRAEADEVALRADLGLAMQGLNAKVCAWLSP
jgi:hypothetical protein